MKTQQNIIRPLVIILLVAGLVSISKAAAAQVYRIGAGDLLSIMVFGEPDLSLGKVRVTMGGTVSLPLLGEIMVRGLTPGELEQRLTDLLADGYLKKPKVTASIIEYRMFYVSGQVEQPGGYHYVEGLTVRKAIALAGGFTVRASESKLRKIAENEPGNEITVDMDASIGPGDILTVGESFF